MKPIFRLLAVTLTLVVSSIAASATESPLAVDGATTVTPEEALALFDQGIVFVDVRKDSDFDAGRIPGAVHLDVKSALSTETLTEVVGLTDAVVFYCNGHSCMRSSDACAMAVGWGYTTVYYLRDGYPAWEAAGYPIE